VSVTIPRTQSPPRSVPSVRNSKLRPSATKRSDEAANLVSPAQAARLLQHVKLSKSEKRKVSDQLYVVANPDQAERLLRRLVLNKETIRKLGEPISPRAQFTLSAGCCCTSHTHIKQR